MIGLYYKEGIKWLDWEDKYDYLVTRYQMLYYHGKVPDRIKDHYLTSDGVYLVRVFMQRLHEGDFYLEGKRWGFDYSCYIYYLWLDKLDHKCPILETCSTVRLRYAEVSWFKYAVENAVHHYIGGGEAIAGALLEDNKIRLDNRNAHVRVDIDMSNTYLPIAINDIRRFMRKKKRIISATWTHGKIIEALRPSFLNPLFR